VATGSLFQAAFKIQNTNLNMIKQKLSMFALTALAAVAFTATNASALTYTSGDLLLGFRSGGAETNDYIVNLGNNSQFRNSDGTAYTGSAFNVSIGGTTTGALATDLNTVFGSNWSTRTDLYWGIIGALNPAAGVDRVQTVYMSSPTTAAGNSTALTNGSVSAQSGWRSQIASVGGQYAVSTSAAVNSVGLIQAISDSNSWTSKLGNSASINYAWGNAFNTGQTMEASVGSGNLLDLYRLVPTGTGAGSFNVGSFSLNNAGTLSYASAAAVPEPSTYAQAVVALAIVALTIAHKRRRKIQSQS
jgi:hypothetical protein